MPSQSLLVKYTCKTYEDMVGSTASILRMANLSNSKRRPNLILYGPSGTGKRSAVHLYILKILGSLVCDSLLYFTSSSDMSIQTIRDKIANFVSKKVFKPKIVVFEDMSNMSDGVQQLMRSVIERNRNCMSSPIMCIFITSSRESITESLQGRCSIIHFERLRSEDVYTKLRYIVKEEGISIEEDALLFLCSKTNGDMRQAILCLDYLTKAIAQGDDDKATTMTSFSTITKSVIRETNLFPCHEEIQDLFQYINSKKVFESLTVVHTLIDSGYSGIDILGFMEKFISTSESVSKQGEFYSHLIEEFASTMLRLKDGHNAKLHLSRMMLQLHDDGKRSDGNKM